VKLFLVKRTDHCDYDEHDSAVIRADSESEIVNKLFTLTDYGRDLIRFAEDNQQTDKQYAEYLAVTGYNVYNLTGFSRGKFTITELNTSVESIECDHNVVISSYNAG
jgi:hypothetical protein